MLRVLRAAVARKSSTFSCSSLAIKLNGAALTDPVCPSIDGKESTPPHHLYTHPFRVVFLRHSSSCKGENSQCQSLVTEETETNGNLGMQQTKARETQHSSDGCESQSLKSVEEDAIFPGSEFEDEAEGDLVTESGEELASDPTAEPCATDCAIDMSKVSEDLKEMLQDGYEFESAEEDLSSEGITELLTIDEVKQVLEEVRARDVQIFPVEDRCEWTDLMVVATGISDRHVRGIADALVYKIKKKGNIESSLYPTIEGQVGGRWLVVDCGNIVIHVLNEDSRAYYRLEDLWTGDVRPSTTDEDLEKMLRQAGLKDVVP